MSPSARLAFMGFLLALFTVVCAAQAPSSDWISALDVIGLVPFEVAFQLTNAGSSSLDILRCRTVLSTDLGQPVEVLSIDGFSVDAGEARSVSVASRWDFQRTGVYLVDVIVETAEGVVISQALPFRILPVPLPLAPVTAVHGEGLRTLYQQPINWGLLHIGAPDAWAITHGRREIVVAIIDSGIDHSIPQLAASMWVNPGEVAGNGIDDDTNGYVDDVHGWDFRDGNNCSLVGSPLHWHGTFVAGIIAAQPGDVPMVGVAPGVRIMDVRFLDSKNQFSSRDWDTFAQAVDYAVDNGAHIINLSIFSNVRPPGSFEQAIRRAVQAGVIIVGIAGNTRQVGVLYPGKYDEVLAIAAVDIENLRAGFSSWGPEVAFVAPGSDIVSFLPGGQTGTRSGTSFAAPHVSGTLALILSAHPHLSAAAAVEILAASASPPGGARDASTWSGGGLINAHKAVSP